MPTADVSVPRLFGRALMLRCPRCGSRRTFVRRWLGKYPRCRTCGIRWHREEGFELGAATVNTVITFFVLAVSLAVAFVLTVPDVPVVPLMLLFLGVAVLVPIVVYPFTYTIWLAFDLAAHRPSAQEAAEAAEWVATSAP